MRRIGMAASKMAQGNIVKYNFFVVGISSLVALIIFCACEFCVLAVLLVLSLVIRGMMHKYAPGQWIHIMKLSSIGIGGIIAVLNVCAISVNLKLTKDKI